MAVSTPLATIALALLCTCANARYFRNGDYAPQRNGDVVGSHTYDVIESNDELKKMDFQKITADNGLHAHSAIYAGGNAPTVDVIVAGKSVYANPSRAFTCKLTINGETIDAPGKFTEMPNMLKDEGLVTGYIKCDITEPKGEPSSVYLEVAGAKVLPHSLRVSKITDYVQ